MNHGEAVKDFHIIMQQPAPNTPQLIDQERMLFRSSLIDEEMTELAEAYAAGDIVEVADALADIVYVVIGLAVECGIPFDAVFREVHRSNMSKRAECEECFGSLFVYDCEGEEYNCSACEGKGGHILYSPEGKVQKPVGWLPPDIKRIIEEHNASNA